MGNFEISEHKSSIKQNEARVAHYRKKEKCQKILRKECLKKRGE